MASTVKVFEVCYHLDNDGGAAADGSYVFRTRSSGIADKFASEHTYYGQQATVNSVDVPRRIASRWGV